MISGTLVAKPNMISVVLITSACADVDPHRRGFRRGRDRDDVVEAHHDVGDGHEPDRAPSAYRRALTLLLAVLLGRNDQLDRDPEQQQAADQLEEREPHDLRDDEGEEDAQHAPRRRRRAGCPRSAAWAAATRQASAITTALSPDSRMLIQMIWPTAIQNAGCIMSCHRDTPPDAPYPLPIRTCGGTSLISQCPAGGLIYKWSSGL